MLPEGAVPPPWCSPSQGCCGRGSALDLEALKDRDLGCLLSMIGHSQGARGALTIIHGLLSCLWLCPKPPPTCLPWGGAGQELELRMCLTLFRQLFLKQLDLPWCVVLVQKAGLPERGS